MSIIGAPISRVDGPDKVSGRAKYSAEYHPDDLMYASLIDSTIAAGFITSIDVAAAQRMAGVVLVLTHLNADSLPYLEPETRPSVDPVSGSQLRVLQDARILYAGQPVAAVVAETQARADAAASLIHISYELDHAPHMRFDTSKAQPTSEAAAKRGRGSFTQQGDPEGALDVATFRIDARYAQAREQHHPMEPHATIASWKDGRLTLWSKTQWVGNERDEIARQFGIAPEQVRVINPFVGGAFGSALRTWPHVTIAALAARQVGRPVRVELTRRQMFTSVGARGESRQRVALGADRDGLLEASIHEVVGQTSVYEEFAEPVLGPAGSTYACKNRRTTYELVAMNANTPCPMRGPGWATGLVAQEIAMDELAVALGMDPIILRLRNYADHDPKTGLPWSSNALRECYRIGAERFGWPSHTVAPRSMSDGNDLIGYGMATAIYPARRYPTEASATLLRDGSILVRCATTDMGPGTYTSAMQVAAETLGMPLERVRFELGDSTFPKAMEHGGSTTLASVGSAVQEACTLLRKRIEELARVHNVVESDVQTMLYREGLDHLECSAFSKPGGESEHYAMYGFGAVFVEVRVDADLGTIRVPRILGAYDVGRIVNPKLAHSQCIGGMVGGLGMALLEEVEWDANLGRVTNGTLAEYLVPVCADIQTLEAIFVPSEDLIMNPLGVKGVAELGLCGVAPAIANAVFHATGLRMRDLPITPKALLTICSER